jgi:rhamnosyltransferase
MVMQNKNITFLIAHFDPNGHLAQHIINHIRYISTFATEIIFVSTKMSPYFDELLKPYAKVILRPNFGYDFWSYKVGLEEIKNIGDVDQLILWNTSFICFKPELLYETFFSKIKNDGMYGISSCNSPQFHLQSYFISFNGKSIINSQAFSQWWKAMTPISVRHEVIVKYEVGMSQWFAERQYHLQETFKLSFKEIIKLHINYLSGLKIKLTFIKKITNKPLIMSYQSLNLTHFAWEAIFSKYGIIKAELLIFNPTRQRIERLQTLLNVNQRDLLRDTLGVDALEIFYNHAKT